MLVLITVFLLLLLIFLFALYRPHFYKEKGDIKERNKAKATYVSNERGTPYLIKEDGSDFVILCCADLHLHSDNSAFALTILSRFIEKENPDLVVLLGDNVVGRTDTIMQEKLKYFFEERKQYWAFVLGNHDSEKWIKEECEKRKTSSEEITKEGRLWMFSSLSSSPYCLSRIESDNFVFGVGNSVLNLKQKDNIIRSLFFFDSGDYVPGVKRKAIGSEKRCYSYIHKSQLDWYQKRLEEIEKENNDKRVKSIAFFHIPLPEYQTAFSKARFHLGAKRIYGNNMEKVCASDINERAFETFRTSNSTDTLIVGHDHKNDSSILYKGIRLMYSQGLASDGAYNRRKKAKFWKALKRINPHLSIFNEGVTIIRIKKDGELDISAEYAEREGFLKGLEQYYKSAFIE